MSLRICISKNTQRATDVFDRTRKVGRERAGRGGDFKYGDQDKPLTSELRLGGKG